MHLAAQSVRITATVVLYLVHAVVENKEIGCMNPSLASRVSVSNKVILGNDPWLLPGLARTPECWLLRFQKLVCDEVYNCEEIKPGLIRRTSMLNCNGKDCLMVKYLTIQSLLNIYDYVIQPYLYWLNSHTHTNKVSLFLLYRSTT